MSKLIGTNPNQVPSNADLGTAAFMDKKEFLLSKGSSLSAIDAVIPKTARDIFIYDTSKDSDGGAWRKRTQHTSWYNERLNTTTRGKRKEFPAVAVIVAEDKKVTIYDGDDPSLPMWMVFDNTNSDGAALVSTGDNRNWTSIQMLNGRMAVGMGYGNTTGMGVDQVDFISDSGWRIRTGGGSNYKGTFKGSIAQRRDTTFNGIVLGNLVNETVNDIAMTVLPNAPIDAATGLPVPTIAVATDGGVSVIKDDGTVVDLYRSGGDNEFSHQVAFNKYNNLFFSWGTTNGQERHLAYYETIPTADDTQLTDNYYPSANMGSTAFGSTGQGLVANNGADFAGSSTREHLMRLYHTPESAASNTSSVAYVTSDYNTGWMNGDIKLATLSDTDDTDITGSNILTGDDSTFTSTQGSWVASQSVTSIQSSTLQIVPDSGVNGGAYYELTTTAGTQYIASVEITQDAGSLSRLSAGTSIDISSYNNISNLGSKMNMGVGTHSISFTATGTTTYIWLVVGGGTQQATRFDNVLVSLAEEDRSVNSNGLQVFGTVTKNPVATGADLVAYSGFSSSNYLNQPYNSDLNFGTGDFSMSVWAQQTPNGSGLAYYIFDKADSNGTNRFAVYYLGDANRLDLYSPASGQHIITTSFPSIASWSLITVVRRNSVGYIYHNGNLITSGSFTENLTGDGTARLSIGTRFNQVEPWSVGELALFRMSATAPSPEQIKKIYNDEKHLFQENAQATLYGSSDTVTALAYDDDTELLHVGTSAGRSVFQGLRRIDNTTDAVSTAISANNGMVAEQ